jgi:Protein of unknown function (DUF4235)
VDKSTQSHLSKLIGTAIALAAAMAAQRTVSSLWKAMSGHTPPNDDDANAGLVEVAAAAVITGAIVALVRVLVIRAAARALR